MSGKEDIPKNDDDYVSSKNEQIPVQKDDETVEDPIDAETADSDKTLAQDEKDAIDSSNIIEERTRGAAPNEGYREPGETEGIEGA